MNVCDLELDLLRSFLVRSDSLAGLPICDFQRVAKGSPGPKWGLLKNQNAWTFMSWELVPTPEATEGTQTVFMESFFGLMCTNAVYLFTVRL